MHSSVIQVCRRPAATAGPSYGTIERAGCRLHYRVSGEGEPVLLIQGVGVHGEGWRPQVEALAPQYRCVTFDNRGMGKSQPVGEPITIEQMADDAAAVLYAAGVEEPAHIIGHSLGGCVALQLALKRRDRVRSLSLLCTFASGKHAAPMTWRMFWAGTRTRIGPRAWRRRAFLELVMPPTCLPAIDRDALAAELAPLFGHDLGDQPPVVSAQLKALKAFDVVNRLGELTGLPTLVVSAEHDPIAPPSAGRVIAQRIAGARYVEIAGVSHGVPLHLPDKINALLEEHLRTMPSNS
jgi:pimeloyl-ACP methyl ester carboxylesterase